MAVWGNPEARHGIVLTADYMAKWFGVKTGTALWEAKQVKLKNVGNITVEIAEAAYLLYKKSYRLPADEEELKNSIPEFYRKPLRNIGICGTDLVTEYSCKIMQNI